MAAQRLEKQVAANYAEEGWTVLCKGWPDLFMFRVLQGKLQIKFREVKGAGDRLRPEQLTILDALHKFGLDAATVWIKTGKETPGCSDPAVSIPNPILSEPIKTRSSRPEYQKAEDGAYLIPSKSPQGRPTFIRRYPCPECGKLSGPGTKTFKVCSACVRHLLGWPATSIEYDFRLSLHDGLFTAVRTEDETVVLFTGPRPELQEWLTKNYPRPAYSWLPYPASLTAWLKERTE